MTHENEIERFTVNDKTVIIEQDTDPTSPRDYDQLGVMVMFNGRNRYGFADRDAEENEINALRRGGFKLLGRYLRRFQGATQVVPWGMLDHSGISIWAGGGTHWSDAAGWDSGTAGFIYDTAETRANTGAPLDSIKAQLEGEIEEMNQYLTGDVYGYVIESSDGDDLDCGWGFFGFDYCKAEARSVAEGMNHQLPLISGFALAGS